MMDWSTTSPKAYLPSACWLDWWLFHADIIVTLSESIGAYLIALWTTLPSKLSIRGFDLAGSNLDTRTINPSPFSSINPSNLQSNNSGPLHSSDSIPFRSINPSPFPSRNLSTLRLSCSGPLHVSDLISFQSRSFPAEQFESFSIEHLAPSPAERFESYPIEWLRSFPIDREDGSEWNEERSKRQKVPNMGVGRVCIILSNGAPSHNWVRPTFNSSVSLWNRSHLSTMKLSQLSSR